ncbi:MAG: sterol desaturase family protein [Microthrixaceae bacterium]
MVALDGPSLAKLAIVPLAVVLVASEGLLLRRVRGCPSPSLVHQRVAQTGYSVAAVAGSAWIGLVAKVVGLVLAVPTLVLGEWLVPLAPFTQPTGVAGLVYALVVTDLLLYVFHRLSHRTTVGWASHVTHHDTPYFDLGVALRVEVFPVVGFVVFPLRALFGVSASSVAVAFLVHGFYMGIIHTELIDRLPRPFEFLLNTPSHHRVHHLASDRRGHNLGSILIVWDRLFGTFRDEDDIPHTYGVDAAPRLSWSPALRPVENFYRVLRSPPDVERQLSAR